MSDLSVSTPYSKRLNVERAGNLWASSPAQVRGRWSRLMCMHGMGDLPVACTNFGVVMTPGRSATHGRRSGWRNSDAEGVAEKGASK